MVGPEDLYPKGFKSNYRKTIVLRRYVKVNEDDEEDIDDNVSSKMV